MQYGCNMLWYWKFQQTQQQEFCVLDSSGILWFSYRLSQ